MFSNFGSWAKVLVDEASTTLQSVSAKMETALDSQVPEMRNNLDTANTSKSGADREVFWDETPAAWVGRESDWAQAALLLLVDVNTFLVAPARVAARDGVDLAWEELVLTPDVVALCMAAASACPTLQERRFDLVPKWTSEQLFWSNLSWRLRELGKCDGTPSTVSALIAHMNTETAAATTARKKNVGIADNKSALGEITLKYNTWVSLRTKLDNALASAKEDMKGARDNVRLLSSLNDRSDVELRESIFQSCRYQKQKFGARIAEVTNLVASIRTEAMTCRSVEQLTVSGEDTIVELHSVNESLMALLKTESQRVVTSTTNHDESPIIRAATPTSPPTPVMQNSAEGLPVSTAAHPTVLNEDYFTAKLPWE